MRPTTGTPDLRSMWGPENGPRPVPDPANEALFAHFHLEVTVEFPVAASRVWALVSDPTRIGSFSPECIQARWIEGRDRAEVGSRFEGTNRIWLDDGRLYEWIRPCTVTRCIAPRVFAYMTHDRWNEPATEWTFAIEPTAGGCALTQSMRVVPAGLPGLRVDADADPARARALLEARMPQLRGAMLETLERMRSACSTR